MYEILSQNQKPIAHCIWYNDNSGKIAFTNIEDIAHEHKLITDLRSLPISHVDLPLPELQEEYFSYTSSVLAWVNYERRSRAGKPSIPPRPALLQVKQPLLRLAESA
jgi:hypothetical protein